MTDQEYLETKKAICSAQSFCSNDCPFYRYLNEQGVHACGCLCEVLEQREPEKAKEIASVWISEHQA